MKHENDVSNMVGSVSKLCEVTFLWKKFLKVYMLALYIVFLFVKMENDNSIKEMKHVIRAFIALWKPRQSLWEFEQISENPRRSQGFLPAREFSQTLRSPRFLPGYEGTENVFYFLRKKKLFKMSRNKQWFLRLLIDCFLYVQGSI